ncbi:MAG TPA: DUF302 domain-containing protein [Pseudonocardia sp.]|nr:DUF302 domain-containing protein [Pseudonocardia sp.]
MSVPAGAPARTTTAARRRLLGTAVAALLLGTGCAEQDFGTLAPPTAPAGQPAGTLVRPAEADVATTVQGVRDAITAAGGTVTAVVEHTADASAAGVRIPPSIEVIGGPPAAALPLLRVNQHAGMNLPQRYLVREATHGSVSVATNSARYVAAVSGVPAPEAQTVLHDSTTAVLEAVAGAGAAHPAPLVGVTPTDRIVERSADGEVAGAVERLRDAADQAPTRTVAVVDMAAGSEVGGPPVRPTTLVLVSHPEAEAPLLAAAPTIGIDLPLPFLVWVDQYGDSRLAHPDVRRLAERHGLAPDDPAVDRLAAEAERLAVAGATIGGRSG